MLRDGVTTKADDDIMEARKENFEASSILGRAKLVFFDILEVFAWITITLKGIIWSQCSGTRSPC